MENLLLTAWSKEWDVDFKLHAPQQTTVEVSFCKGKVVSLKVVPESRQKEIVFTADFNKSNYAKTLQTP